MTRQEIRDAINKRPLTDFITLQKPRKYSGADMYVCPVCQSGTGQNGTGAFKIYPNNRVTCMKGCFASPEGKQSQDTLGALRIIWGCGETEAITRAGYNIDTPRREEPEEAEEKDFSEFYRVSHERLIHSEEALKYLHDRGITDESINTFNLGYDPHWKHSKASERVRGDKRIIIPRSSRSYLSRRIYSEGNRFDKMNEGTARDIFNISALETAQTAIICEGELDAISIMQCGAPVSIGIGSISNRSRMIDEMKKHPDIIYAVALDNDKLKEDGSAPGQDAQKYIIEQAENNGITVLNLNLAQFYCNEKDANAALVKQQDSFKRMVKAVLSIADQKRAEQDEARAEEMYKRTGAGMVDSFLFRSESREYEPIPTGIREIDRATGGGLIKKTVVTLGAAPGMGKTALAQWILENMAKAGRDILYINLEMSRDQLIARSLSRYAFKYFQEDVSALDIMRGYNWTPEQREAIFKAAEKYKNEVANHLIYNPEGNEGELTAELNSILKAMNAETVKLTSQGKEAPIVCIDYLQLVRGESRDDDATTIKRALKSFKDYAIENNTIVLCIVANNRASNKSGVSDMESGRDTSNLEYSGDIMLGLVYTAIEDGREIPDSGGKAYTIDAIRKAKREAYDKAERQGKEPEVPRVCKEVTLKINKNRFGQDERRAKLIFDGKHMLYSSANSFVPMGKKENTPFSATYNGVSIS